MRTLIEKIGKLSAWETFQVVAFFAYVVYATSFGAQVSFAARNAGSSVAVSVITGVIMGVFSPIIVLFEKVWLK